MSEQMDYSGPEWDGLRREMRQWWLRQRPDRAAEEDSGCECEELRAEVERLRACLLRANSRMEEAERSLYLQLQAVEGERDRLRAELEAVRQRVGDAYFRDAAAETTHKPTGDSLIDRLRGIYTVPVNDGAGLLNGKDTFTRRFPALPINVEAAAEIERLQSLARTALDERDYWKGVAESYEGGG